MLKKQPVAINTSGVFKLLNPGGEVETITPQDGTGARLRVSEMVRLLGGSSDIVASPCQADGVRTEYLVYRTNQPTAKPKFGQGKSKEAIGNKLAAWNQKYGFNKKANDHPGVVKLFGNIYGPALVVPIDQMVEGWLD